MNGRTEVQISNEDTINGDRYCRLMILLQVRLFYSYNFVFIEDNAKSHQTVFAEKLLETEDIIRIDWLAHSPDLNPIKNNKDTSHK